MNKTLNKLKPIEKLYLISKEKEGVFSKQNRLYCLIYSLLENKNLKLSNTSSKFKIQYNGINSNTEYENKFISLIKEKNFIELNNFMNDLLVFNKTLIENNILKLETKARKFLFFKLAKEEISKTSLYFELQAEFNKQLEENKKILDIVCINVNTKDKIMNFYNVLKQKMKEAQELEDKKNKK